MPKKINPDKNKANETKNKTTKLGNVYDDILRENAPKFFKPLLEQVLGFKIISFSYVPEKKTQTLMREMDFFYIIQTTEEMGGEMILHIEFQTQKAKGMIYRMAEYHGIALRRHQLPIKHVVIYLGSNKIDMVSELKPSEVFTSFELINLWAIDLQESLSAQVPEVIILAILTNYPKEQLEAVLRSIIKRLQSVVEDEQDLQRYLLQLSLLARLRDKTNLTNKILQEMPIYYDVENDSLYQQGLKKGQEILQEKIKEMEREKIEVIEKERKKMQDEKERERKKMQDEKEKLVKALISVEGFDETKIAKITNISVERIKQIKEELEQ